MAWLDPIVGVLVLAVIVSLLRGGRLSNVTEIRLKWWWLLFAGLAIQIVAAFLPRDQQDLAVALILASYVPLIVVVLVNRSLPGMWIAGVGILMNFSVIAMNGGMPVSAEAAVLAGAASTELIFDAKHVLLDSGSDLAMFADVIPIPLLNQVISLGDVLLAMGLGMFLEAQLRRPIHWFKHGGRGQPGSAAETRH